MSFHLGILRASLLKLKNKYHGIENYCSVSYLQRRSQIEASKTVLQAIWEYFSLTLRKVFFFLFFFKF